MMMVMFAGVTGCFAQFHDGVAQAQFSVSETGAGSLGDGSEDAISLYKLIHGNSYYQNANKMGKFEQRTAVKLLLGMERNHAVAIDSSFAARYQDAVLDIADRSIDMTWTFEGQKIEEAMSRWQANISQILTCGGAMADYQRYKNEYECIKASIAAVGKAHLSNAHRKECYLMLCKDINERNALLAAGLRGLLGAKFVEKYAHGRAGAMPLTPRKDLARISLAVWRTNLKEASMNAVSRKRNSRESSK